MRRLVLLLWLGLATPVLATVDGWPALYDVAGVASDDVLNIRERPDVSSPVIGTFAPDATGIEVIVANEEMTWGRVNAAERSGWVSLAYLERRPGQWDGALPQIQSCFGTEPFWNFTRTSADRFRFEALGEEPFTLSVIESASSENRRDSFHVVTEGSDGPSVAVLETEACNDGMSDRNYGISVQLVLGIGGGSRHISGCCSLAPQ